MSRTRALSPVGIVLAVSLIVNALLVGLLIGRTLGDEDRPPKDRGGRGGDEFEIARAIEQVVPEDTHDDIRSAFREAFREARPLIGEKRSAQRALRETLAADPFDRDAMRAAFENIRTIDDRLTRTFQGTLVEELAELTPQQRQDMAAWLDEMDERRRERRDRRGKRGGPPPDERRSD